MAPTPVFQIANSLRRGKSNPPGAEKRESKAEHVLGITQTDLNMAVVRHNYGIGSGKLPRISLSDATTELGSASVPTDKAGGVPELRLKASSVLLHEEYLQGGGDTTSSIRSRRLKNYDSSSTLHSHYDVQKTPLSVSQQTSDSSRRDFALRKGTPVVVNSTTPDKDSLRQFRLFKTSKNRGHTETKKLSKPIPGSPHPSSQTTSTSRRSVSSDWTAVSASGASRSVVSDRSSKAPPKAATRFQSGMTGRSPSTNLKKAVTPAPARASTLGDAAYVKVNVRRPRVGAKYWFDGLEGDTSEEESIDEPELQQNFVNGMESAFQNGRIGPTKVSDSAGRVPTLNYRTRTPATNSAVPKNSMPRGPPQPRPATPSQISTLSAKASKSTLRQTEPPAPGTKQKTKKTLSRADLNQDSILSLSSSDEEDEAQDGDGDVKETERTPTKPTIRDSIAVDSLRESTIEIGTARAVSAKRALSTQPAPDQRKIKRGSRGPEERTRLLSMVGTPQPRGVGLLTYLSDQSSEPALDGNDLLNSFPSTPIETASSYRASVRSSICSDNGSVESRRLMSVTRQEESLLAAIRLKKAVMRHHQAAGSRERRTGDLDKGVMKSIPHTDTAGHGSDTRARPQTRTRDQPARPIYFQRVHDGSSSTTLQTNSSRDLSTRFSLASFHTDMSVDPEREASPVLSPGLLPIASPSMLSRPDAAKRLSRGTYFSTSSGTSQCPSPNGTIRSHSTPLNKLDQGPTRDEIRSQDFIDWPYNGWEARLLTLAH